MDTLLKLSSSAEIKNEWSQTSAVPVCFHGVDRVNFTFFPFAGRFCTDRIVSNQWTIRVVLGHFRIEFIGNSSCLVTSLAFSCWYTIQHSYLHYPVCSESYLWFYMCLAKYTILLLAIEDDTGISIETCMAKKSYKVSKGQWEFPVNSL
jgi:hypothetical protein